MDCKNHSGIEASDRCAGCAEGFCLNCLVELSGQNYCKECKYMTVKEPPVIEKATTPCKEASDALKYAIFGLFCFGIILGPIAISKARKAKETINADPKLAGSGKATAAIIIGSLSLIIWLLNILQRAIGV
jgi:hypothetical protein